ncbi:MAG: right-handed parallel beta-helix repeat-containing protein, partial [Clostridiales bacterium]|nr:right-handed parallel beta-helix repeat-containing protein [Clostridiales bacterium]
PETTAAQTTFPTETAAPETTVPETQPTATVDAVPVQKDSQYESAQPGIAEPVITTGQTTVHVSTADEFLAAIASDTEIIVDAELIDFSTASNYGTYGTSEGNYRWNEEFDGPELIIQNVSNLTVRGSGEERTDKVLSCVPRYADVLTFENCANIYVTHITAGHTQEPSQCAGGVLHFINSQDILVEDCDLYGCGTLGVDADNSLNIQVINNLIHDCSYGGVQFSNCQNVRVDGNTFRDLGMEGYPGSVFRIYDSQNVTCNGKDAIPFQ